MKEERQYRDDVMANIDGRIRRLSRKNKKAAEVEQEEIDAVLSGKVKIERNMMCKNCKWFNKMYGTLRVIKNTQQLERVFVCSECHLTAHIDYIQRPMINALRVTT